ncbi:MAG: hypothetical protein P4L56_01005 [Candidatus Sulfopaludibacter sp.]|nr:hypothetical protein [Candidatus Sulfopaludibacter sp.]
MSDSQTVPATSAKRIGVAADRGGFELKQYLAAMLREAHYEVFDFGDGQPKPDDGTRITSHRAKLASFGLPNEGSLHETR